MFKQIIGITRDYGPLWVYNRSLYSMKLKTLNKFKFTERFYEKEISVKNINLFDFNIKELEEFYIGLDDKETKKIINKANKAIDGKILAFSSTEVHYGNPINWHYNPFTNKSHNKSKKWFQIPDFDQEVGDIKAIWEINRLTHFLDFSRAYIITKDLKYFDAFNNQVHDWLHNNAYSYGANYKCGQEATIRMVNLMMSYSVFNYFKLIDIKLENNIKQIIKDSYKKVLSNFFYAYKCIINNHTFTEILGRIIGAWVINDEKELKYSMKLMDKEIDRQFTMDGGFKQYSYNYHRFTLQIFEVLLKIEPKLEMSLTPKSKEKLNKSVIKLYNLSNINGYLPNYGSNDGALIFPLSNACYRDYRPVLNTIYAQLNKKQLYEKSIITEETIWFANSSTLPIITKEKESMNLNDIGVYSFRDKNSMALIHLNDYKSRPAHMDQLHFELWYDDFDIFCDLGTYSYASDIGKELTINTNHNTIKVDDYVQMSRFGAFMVYDWTKVVENQYSKNVEFKGEYKTRKGYSHIRTINKTEYGYDIIDQLNKKVDKFSISFNTPFKPIIVNGNIEMKLPNNKKVLIATEGKISILRQKRSLYYLKLDEIYKINIEIRGKDKASTKIHLLG